MPFLGSKYIKILLMELTALSRPFSGIYGAISQQELKEGTEREGGCVRRGKGRRKKEGGTYGKAAPLIPSF